jgi:hypothetical protein
MQAASNGAARSHSLRGFEDDACGDEPGLGAADMLPPELYMGRRVRWRWRSFYGRPT